MHTFKRTATAALLAALAISLACPAANAQALGSNNPGDTTTISSTGTTTNGSSNNTSSYNGNQPYDGYDNSGTLTVTGGTFNHDYNGLANYGTATISGGSFEGDNTGVTSNGSSGSAVVTITGGTFGSNSADISAVGGGVIDVYGTAFNNITGAGFTSGFGQIKSGFTRGSFDWTNANGVTQTLTYVVSKATIDLIQTPSGVMATPEPSAWLAFGIGALALGALTLRAKKRTT